MSVFKYARILILMLIAASCGGNTHSRPSTAESMGRVPTVSAFICSYWEDVNRNKQMESDEFIKTGWEFTTAEPVTLCLGTRMQSDFARSVIILDSERDVVYEERKVVEVNSSEQMVCIKLDAGNVPEGAYSVIWSIDGVEVASLSFEVTEVKEPIKEPIEPIKETKDQPEEEAKPEDKPEEKPEEKIEDKPEEADEEFEDF